MEKTFKIITSDNTSIDAESLANAIGFAYDYGDKLKVEEVASRESRTLSAVPSEEEIEKWYIESYGVTRDLNGKPSWNSRSVGYRTDGDLFEMLNDFAKWIKQRGIAG